MGVFTRYKRASFFIIIIFFCAFIALFDGLLYISKCMELENITEDYKYKNEDLFELVLGCEASPDMILSLADGIDRGNIIIRGPFVYFDEVKYANLSDIILLQNEDLKIPTDTGIKRIGEREIIIPSDTDIAGDRIICRGNELEVTGIVDAEKTRKAMNRFYLRAEDYFTSFEENLTMRYVDIYVQSDAENEEYQKIISKLKDNIAENINTATLLPLDNEQGSEVIYSALQDRGTVYSALLYLFSLVNCLTISFYWISVRRREIAIRKAFGANNRLVIKIILTEMFSLFSVALLGALTVQTIIYHVSGGLTNPAEYLRIIMGYLLLLFISTGISLIIPLFVINRVSPLKAVK